MAVGSNPALDSLVAVRNSSPGRPVPCEGNLVAAAGSCGGLMVRHPWPLLEISLPDFRRLATLNINTKPNCRKILLISRHMNYALHLPYLNIKYIPMQNAEI